MNLKEIAAAVKELASNHSVLLYGPPKTGKTKLAGTAAKIKEFSRIFWFDGENGHETLLNMGLTDEELAKITLFRIKDTRRIPTFIETVLKSFNTTKGVSICDKHGKVDCQECKKEGSSFTPFDMRSLTHNDLVVVDSGSQLADSALNACMLGADDLAKPGWDEYAIQGKWLSDILSTIQAANHTNFLVITHEIALEDDDKKDKFFPLMGTKNFSMKVSKYFGTVVYVEKKMGKHVAGSSSLYRHNVLTGSRVNATIEKQKEPDMRTIFIEGGVLKEGSMTSEPIASTTAASPPVVQTTETITAKPMTLKERLAAKAAQAK